MSDHRLLTRRRFLKSSSTMAAAGLLGSGMPCGVVSAQEAGERPTQAAGVTVLNPRGRVPVSFIIDDSTCLVNVAHFKIPQLAEVYPDRYRQDWRKLPREIPDSFVRKFGEWCREHGVKGKYSVVPYPACVGWIDRRMPGWSRKELEDSLALVRDFMTVDWDIHPEMVSHTFAVDTKTGRPYAEKSEKYLENTGFSVGMSTDEMTEYIAYALEMMKNAGLPCEGVTTPGGFGSRARPALAEGTLQAVRGVYGAEIPHYFRDLFTDERSVAPLVQNVRGLDTDDPQCVVHTIGCTGDWFGGWDGLGEGSVDRFITADLQGGRMPEVIDREQPAIMVCHWPGIYYNGEERGFLIFQEVVRRLHARNDNLIWMKLSEIARYWAAKELTRIEERDGRIDLSSPFACREFTFECTLPGTKPPRVVIAAADGLAAEELELREVKRALDLKSGTWFRDGERVTLCVDLPQRRTVSVKAQA